jgi:hypothetical protein
LYGDERHIFFDIGIFPQEDREQRSVFGLFAVFAFGRGFCGDVFDTGHQRLYEHRQDDDAFGLQYEFDAEYGGVVNVYETKEGEIEPCTTSRFSFLT